MAYVFTSTRPSCDFFDGVIVLSQQPCIEIAQISHGALAASIRRPCRDRTCLCDPCVFFGNSCTKRVQLLIFNLDGTSNV